LKDEDTKKDYDYMLDHPGMLSAVNPVYSLPCPQCFWIRNWSHIAIHLVVLFLVVLSVSTLQRSLRLRCFKLD